MIRCGDIIIDRKKCTVECNGAKYVSPRGSRSHVFELLVHHILGAGISAPMFVELLWGDDPDGGPDDPRNQISVMQNRICKHILPKLGLELRAWRLSGVNYYHICQKHQLVTPKRFVGSPEYGEVGGRRKAA